MQTIAAPATHKKHRNSRPATTHKMFNSDKLVVALINRLTGMPIDYSIGDEKTSSIPVNRAIMAVGFIKKSDGYCPEYSRLAPYGFSPAGIRLRYAVGMRNRVTEVDKARINSSPTGIADLGFSKLALRSALQRKRRHRDV